MRLGNRIGFVSITRSIAWEIVFVIEMQEAKEVSVLPSVLFDVVVTWKTNDRPSRFPNFENEDGGGGEEVEEEEEEDGRSAFRTRDPSLCRHATHYIYSTPSLYAYSSYYYYYYYTSSSYYYYYSSSHAWIPRMLGKSWNGRSRKRSIIDVTTNNDDVHMFHPSICVFFFGFYDI